MMSQARWLQITCCAVALQSSAAAPASEPIGAQCSLRLGLAVMCLEGRADAAANAAALFRRYGLNKAELSADYVNAYARQFECGVLRPTNFPEAKLRVLYSGRVADDRGWVDVDRIGLESRTTARVFYVARAYLSPACFSDPERSRSSPPAAPRALPLPSPKPPAEDL
jgi:hypothetical protein